ncbi:hypothetical protein [Petrachloros mirabilis]
MNGHGLGPIYGVRLESSLPFDPAKPEGMRQALPSHDDLKGIMAYGQGHRVVAGYEVVLEYWRTARDLLRDAAVYVPHDGSDLICRISEMLNCLEENE